MITHSKSTITEQDINAVNDTLVSGMIAPGEMVKEFESSIAEYIGTKYCKLTTSGTSALDWILRIMKISTNDEIIIPNYVCHNVLDAITHSGATPVLCDIGNSWTMTPETVKPLISKKTKAIIIVHIFGIPIDMEIFSELGIPLIEDCCQSFGATTDGRVLGSFGDMSFFSFHATKCLTTGNGGAIVSNKFQIPEEIIDFTGLSDLQAALGLSQLKNYDYMLDRRRYIAEKYLSTLQGRYPVAPSNSIFFRFPIKVKKEFDSLKRQFEDHNIRIRKGVDALLHSSISKPDKLYPNAIDSFRHTISIPIYPGLSEQDCDHIIETMLRIL